jgi:hypothetical protein
MISPTLAHRRNRYDLWVNENRGVHQSYRSHFQSILFIIFPGSGLLRSSAQIYQFLCEHDGFSHLSYLTELPLFKTSTAIL